MPKGLSGSKFIFVGNDICLDFINTQVIRRGRLVDLIGDFSDLVNWLAEAGVLDSVQARTALRRWNDNSQGERTLERARELRVVLRDTVERIANGKSVGQSAIDEINNLLRNRVGYTQLVRVKRGVERQFNLELNEPIQLITPIAESAGDLLCYSDFSLIKKCENPNCVLYFYDVSKNHARRWCSMNICGNRIKVAAYYRRHQL
ncbi:MAG: hypothetical protein C4291_08580 [Candidatus Dadabacteria bacterium]